MPLTYTGRSVKRGGDVYPSLVDIAVGISRQPRFAGQGRRWFSVLDHSLFADELVKRASMVPILSDDDEDARKRWRLAVLLHDAHEAITGDVPTDFKGIELKHEQERMDLDIAMAFYPIRTGQAAFTHPDVRNAVKHIDRRALAAEARVIGPPVPPERILSAFGITDDTPQDITLLEDKLRWNHRWFGVPPTVDSPETHPGVQEYLRRVLELM